MSMGRRFSRGRWALVLAAVPALISRTGYAAGGEGEKTPTLGVYLEELEAQFQAGYRAPELDAGRAMELRLALIAIAQHAEEHEDDLDQPLAASSRDELLRTLAGNQSRRGPDAPSLPPGISARFLSVRSIFDKLEGLINKAIADASDQARSLIVVAGGQLLALLQNFRTVLDGVLDKAFDQLDDAQRNLVGGLDILITRSVDNLGEEIDKVRASADQLTAALNRSVIGSEAPWAGTPAPLVHVSKPAKRYAIRIRGDFLNHEKNRMIVAGKPKSGQVVTRTEGELLFEFTGEELGVAEADDLGDIVNRSLELHLFRKEASWWCAWLCKSDVPLPVATVRVSIVPRKWGRYLVKSVTTVGQEKVQDYRSGPLDSGASGHNSCVTKPFSMPPDTGFRFLSGTAAFTQTACARLRCSHTINFTPNALTVSLTACPRHDHRNRLTGFLTAKQVSTTTKEVIEQVADAELPSESDRAILLPANTKGFILTFIGIGGDESIFTSAGTNRFIEVEHAQSTNTLVVRARIPKDLLQLP